MATKVIGGGSSAVAASSHAACARFRGTDPLITGRSRRALAKSVGFEDDFGGIPEARWMRAMAFEHLVRDKRFASQLTTTAVGRLGLDRPSEVFIVYGGRKAEKTAELLEEAHARAISDGAATMLYELALPFAGFEGEGATEVMPDFAVVASKPQVGGVPPTESWLIVGDAKDYERIRSRIDDTRLLKGFLQVALGAESAAVWSMLPADMSVHSYGALAVPRNSFLQPEAVVELLDDHREEVRMRIAERKQETKASPYQDDGATLDEYVDHLEATFDPSTCSSCTLFAYCRSELRKSSAPVDLLVEIGVPPVDRPNLVRLVENGEMVDGTAPSLLARVRATLDGVAQRSDQARVDNAGRPGTVNVLIAKSDSAALGVYGIATQVVTSAGAQDWTIEIFDESQSLETRRAVMSRLGTDLMLALEDRLSDSAEGPKSIHLVVPDSATSDVLTSIADNLAGIELSRLRWQRDIEKDRPALTYNGDPADIPDELPVLARTGVSFLLEEDRARAMSLRSPIINVQSELARHFIAGGPSVNALRLDYLAGWAKATSEDPTDHRQIADDIEAELHTPGARLTNRQSDAIHSAFTGRENGAPRPADPDRYESLIKEELGYKISVLTDAIEALETIPDSALRTAYDTVEADAQVVWRRRHAFHASDLVRFGRTSDFWRNQLVPLINDDTSCSKQLTALINPHAALESAKNAGSRELATARVLQIDPLVIEIGSRRIGLGERVVLLHRNGEACVESPGVQVEMNKGSFKVGGLAIGPLGESDAGKCAFTWSPLNATTLQPGDELIVADFTWFCNLKRNSHLSIGRPKPDSIQAPTEDCTPESFENDEDGHRFCCQPHEAREAQTSDWIAIRRARGELNPETWPPVIDTDAFEVTSSDTPVANPDTDPVTSPDDDVTIDDLD